MFGSPENCRKRKTEYAFRLINLDWQHRYYGESLPYGSRDEAYKNATTLSFLTAEQALADYAVLITDLKRNLSAQGCPVVLFGGSYGGSKAFLSFTSFYLNSLQFQFGRFYVVLVYWTLKYMFLVVKNCYFAHYLH